MATTGNMIMIWWTYRSMNTRPAAPARFSSSRSGARPGGRLRLFHVMGRPGSASSASSHQATVVWAALALSSSAQCMQWLLYVERFWQVSPIIIVITMSNYCSSATALRRREVCGQRRVCTQWAADLFSTRTTLPSKDCLGHFGCVNAIEFSPGGEDLIVSGTEHTHSCAAFRCVRIVSWNVSRCLVPFHSNATFLKVESAHTSVTLLSIFSSLFP